MKPLICIIVVIIAIIGIILGLLAYSYTQIHVNLNAVSLRSIDWESITWSTLLKLGLNVLTGNWLGAAFNLIQGINLDLIFGLSNYGVLPVYIPDLSYDLSINDVPVGHGYSNVDVTINPGDTKEITVLQHFQKSSLAPAVESIVSTGGIIDLHVSGTAYFKLLGISIPVPFESSKQVSIKEEIKNHLNAEIQKNQQQSSNSLGNTLKQSLDNTFESIKNTFNGVVNALNQFAGQKAPQSSEKIQTQIYLENVKNTKKGQSVVYIGSLFYVKDGKFYGVSNAKVGVLADWQMPYYPPNQDPLVGFTYTDQYGKFEISWTAKENPLTKDSSGSTWSPRAYFSGNDEFEKSEGGMGLASFRVLNSDTVKTKTSSIVKEGDFVTMPGPNIDPNTDTIKWKQVNGEHVDFSTTTNGDLTFIAPDVEKGKTKTISFQFTVTDRFGVSNSDTIEVTVLSRD